MAPNRSEFQLGRNDVFMGIVVLLAGIKYTWGLRQSLDVYLYDESNYLYAGVTLWQHPLPTAAFAPLYAIWVVRT